MSSPKILVWDLEFRASQKYNGSLTIYPGYIICFSCKRLGENKVRTYSALTHPGNKITDDKNLVEAIGNELRDADIHVFHYGAKADFKFIQTKLLYYGFDRIPIPAAMIDTCKIAQQNLALKSNSLSMLAKFLGLPEQKMEITEDQWYDAFTGHAPTLKIIEKRCASDVRLTEEVYKRLKPLYPNHPMIRRVDFLMQSEYPQKCPDCGAKTHSDGMVATAKTWKERWRCRQCGRCGSVPAREVKP